MTSESQNAPRYLMRKDGTRLAYHYIPGKTPGVIFCAGLMSDMEGGKALALEAWARQTGHQFTRFDYRGHGKSDRKFEEGCIGLWHDDALAILDQVSQGVQIVVGSSMGGWIACLLAKKRPERFCGLVGIAAAPDFTERLWQDDLSEDQRKTVKESGFVAIPSDYGPDPYIFTQTLFEDGLENRVLKSTLFVDFPVRLIQGLEDADVPWQTAITLAKHFYDSGTKDIESVLIPGGDHRLSEDSDLARLIHIVEEIAKGHDHA